jgi:hypothetical protein
MIGILIAIVLAAIVYWICVAIGLPFIIAAIAALFVLLAGIPHGTWGGYYRGRGPRDGGL